MSFLLLSILFIVYVAFEPFDAAIVVACDAFSWLLLLCLSFNLKFLHDGFKTEYRNMCAEKRKLQILILHFEPHRVWGTMQGYRY